MSARLSIAVCVSGQMRTFAENRDGLERMLATAAGPGAEVCWLGALHAADAQWVHTLDWTSVQVLQMQRVHDFGADVPLVYPTVNDKDRPRAAWEQWQGLLSVGQQVRFVEEIRGRRFDWVIRLRPDLAVINPMESLAEMPADAIYTPRHNNWGGINDRFGFGPSVLMERYFTYPREAWRFFLAAGLRTKRNPEGMLGWHLANERIPLRRTSAVLMPRRANGQIDSPVYRTDRGDEPEAAAA